MRSMTVVLTLAAVVIAGCASRRKVVETQVVETPAPSSAGVVDISWDENAPFERKSVRLKADDVLLIEVANGPRAAVQFTRFDWDKVKPYPRGGTYRWRCRRAGSADVASGEGTVVEKYEEVSEGQGRQRVLALPGNDTTVRAGDVRAEWSWADGESGYVYYHPRRAKVTILPAASFSEQP